MEGPVIPTMMLVDQYRGLDSTTGAIVQDVLPGVEALSVEKTGVLVPPLAVAMSLLHTDNDIHRVDVNRLQFTYGIDGQEATFLATREELCKWAVTQCTMGRHLCAVVMKGKKKEFKDPDEPDDKATDIKIKKYFRDLDEVRKNKEKCEADTAAFLMFSLKRCHPALRRRLQTMTKPKRLEDIASMAIWRVCLVPSKEWYFMPSRMGKSLNV